MVRRHNICTLGDLTPPNSDELDAKFLRKHDFAHLSRPLCREEPILLIDWQLPGLTFDIGDNQVLSTLRNMVPQLKIIALGMYSESKTYALNAGFDAYISKTGVPEQLSVFEQIFKGDGY